MIYRCVQFDELNYLPTIRFVFPPISVILFSKFLFLSTTLYRVCAAGVRIQWRRSEHRAVAERAQSVSGKRTDQIIQIRFDDQSQGRRDLVAKQTVHQGGRTFRAGPGTSEKPPPSQVDTVGPRTHFGQGIVGDTINSRQ